TPDVHSARADALFDSRAPVIISVFGEFEFTNAIELRVARREITPAQADASISAFQADVSQNFFDYRGIIPAPVYRTAISIARDHTRSLLVRSLDVLHVASAIEFGAKAFYTFDVLQAKLARAVGLTVRPVP